MGREIAVISAEKVEEVTGEIYDICNTALAVLNGAKLSRDRQLVFLVKEIMSRNTSLHDHAILAQEFPDARPV